MVTLDVIEIYKKFGWSLIPITFKDKTPLRPWKYSQYNHLNLDYFKSILKDEINLAVVCGSISNNLIGIDLDGPLAIKTYKELFPESIPDTVRMYTGNGERHFFKGNIRTKHFHLDTGSISFLAEKSYALIPPSIHPNGKQYTWMTLCGPEEAPILDLPSELIDWYNKTEVKRIESEVQDKITAGNRNITLFNIASNLVRNKLSNDMIKSIISHINDNCCVPSLDRIEMETICNSVERYR